MDLTAIEGTLFTIHGLLAGMMRTPELALDQTEAHSLAAGIVGVAQHYNVAATEKTLAWVNLGLVCGTIYGTRIVAINFRTKAERAAARTNTVPDAIPPGASYPFDGMPRH